MTITELRKKVASAEDLNWWKSKETTFNFPYLREPVNIEGVVPLYQFVNRHLNIWKKKENLPPELQKSIRYFTNIKNGIVQFTNSYLAQEENNLNSHWNNHVKNQVDSNIQQMFLSDSPETTFLIAVYKNEPNSFPAAYSYLTGNPNGGVSVNNKSNLIGTILAYEFSRKHKTDLTKRRTSDKKAYTLLTREITKYVSSLDNDLVQKLADSENKYEEYVALIDEIKNTKETLFNEWFETSKSSFDEFNTNSQKAIKDLEDSYSELLRLKKPAEYWKQRAEGLKKEGWRALYWLIGVVALACMSLYFLLWQTPEGMLKSFFNGDASAIKWSLVYVTFLSFFAFGIRALNKVAFSSFHLARDAEEREQLTFVYLALIKDSAVGQEDKNLILQSLFSRADTGLLKSDSNPTMPNDLPSKFFTK